MKKNIFLSVLVLLFLFSGINAVTIEDVTSSSGLMKAVYNNDREAALRYKELGGILDFPYDMPSILCVTMEQNYAVLQLLIDLNENINARSRLLGKISALHYAVQKNDIQAVNILLAAPQSQIWSAPPSNLLQMPTWDAPQSQC